MPPAAPQRRRHLCRKQRDRQLRGCQALAAGEPFKTVQSSGFVSVRIICHVTLLLTLIIPLQQAVFLGVLLSILVHFFVTSFHEVGMALLISNADGTVTEGTAPAELPSNAVTLLEIFGDMAVAGAETLEAQLPKVKQAERPVWTVLGPPTRFWAPRMCSRPRRLLASARGLRMRLRSAGLRKQQFNQKRTE